MHAVEIRRVGEGVSEPMLQMRTWIDRHCIQPALIRLSFHPGKEIRFRLTFESAGEAAVFAEAFGGEVLRGSDTGAVARGASQAESAAAVDPAKSLRGV
jgi:hypothetical protein